MTKKNAQKCPKGNTELLGKNKPSGRDRWFPSFTSYLEEEPFFDDNHMKYLGYGAETCPKTGRKHWQGCVYFYDKVSIKMAQKLLHIGNSHMENIMITSTENCVEYCKKEGNHKEFGEMPKQGKRNDLEVLRTEIVEGRTVDNIIMEHPMIYHQYGRTIEKIADIVLRKKYRTEMTKGIWYWGKTGVGKSKKVFENYTPETHYVVPNDNGWWDAYRQQDTVIINDFRGHIPYGTLLEMVDRNAYSVNRRGKEPIPFISKLVLITSSLHPSLVYRNRQEEDSLEQLNRRFDIIELT